MCHNSAGGILSDLWLLPPPGGCGFPWHCVSIRADESAGDALLQRCSTRRACSRQQVNLPLPQTAVSPTLFCPAPLPTIPLFCPSESKELPHTCFLPSMLQCSGWRARSPPSSPADVAAAGPIAPQSPHLAKEDDGKSSAAPGSSEHVSLLYLL